MKPARQRSRRPSVKRTPSAPAAQAQPVSDGAVRLATLLAEEPQGWRVRLGARELVLSLDASVDPALMHEALEDGARVLVEASATPVVVGVVQTSRALRVDRQGRVDAQVERFELQARQGATVKTSGAFLQVKGSDVELYGTRILTRAREVAKILARMINLN
ncbi:hypothetical protein MYSTI_00349 [Myxococcus stipitatus DSM 14675]|uniref:Uncharacterized protein n=1 Tax=Myxococcus stipitatus (strain DSM 14675 / JCM 12634 / Mx s8) TaxID=1278073 RepID=L7U287_MYXSD|nr:hypothetical protein [Myxococcus stipitatus]AGC41707.1 hypothetical protein MYSTI_00349 [Myxococcus stipitatus DSM 14675]